ncbi:MAG: hypothetical protein BWY11_01127 [Firmicutes bacterium ADurb.Bin182]|nr:MAG: hypothetical protein BWY11_01127 [Firmicutes bacterium ADurb.Bin182]
MKPNRIAAILIIVLLSFSLCSAALAAQFVTEMSPAYMQAAGEASLKLTITNDSDFTMENISVSGLGYLYNIPDSVAPGSTVYCPLSGIMITEDMLNKPLEFTVSWTENGEAKTKNITATVSLGSGAALEATRTADRTQAPTGGQIMLTYTIRNTGAAAVKGISLVDKKIAGSTPLIKDVSLLPGQEYFFSHPFIMGSGYVTSAPVITYTPEGSEVPITYSIPPIDLLMINPKLEVDVTQGPTTPDGTVFTLNIENNGNQTISKISITDELGNKVNEELFVLTVGEKRTLTYTVVTDATRNIRFTIKGVDGTKQPYEDTTKKFEVRPYIDPDLIGLSFGAFSAKALQPDGTMKVRFHLNNTGSVPMHNLTIREIELGELKIIDELPLGESDFELELNVGEPRPMVFTLDATDPVGNPYTFTSYLNAAYLKTDSAPVASPLLPDTDSGSDGAKKIGSISETLLTLLIIIAVLTVFAGIALCVLTEKERRAKRGHKKSQSRADSSVTPRRPEKRREMPGREFAVKSEAYEKHTRSGGIVREKPLQPYLSSRPLREQIDEQYVPRNVKLKKDGGGNYTARPGPAPEHYGEINAPGTAPRTQSAARERPDPQLPFEIRNRPRHMERHDTE